MVRFMCSMLGGAGLVAARFRQRPFQQPALDAGHQFLEVKVVVPARPATTAGPNSDGLDFGGQIEIARIEHGTGAA